jgi:hypothetical protein
MYIPGSKTVVKWLFPWLLKTAMKLGAKAFGRVNTRKHAVYSRRWMWVHVWSPTIEKFRASRTKMDDPLIPYIYTNQACALMDGSALEDIVTVRQAVTNGDTTGAFLALGHLEESLGLDIRERVDE